MCRASSRSRNGATTPAFDPRLSLSRNFHLRGVQLYMDGIPINTATATAISRRSIPTAYKYVEVWKGANALQYGANSLGGAINFVIPTGRDPWPNGVSADIGAFGFKRLQANAGGANGPWDGFVTASTQAVRRLQGPQFRQQHPRQRQCRLSVLTGCRDAILFQRQ
jgi:outer membrane receptor for Fe3+-dicitrate